MLSFEIEKFLLRIPSLIDFCLTVDSAPYPIIPATLFIFDLFFPKLIDFCLTEVSAPYPIIPATLFIFDLVFASKLFVFSFAKGRFSVPAFL